MYQEEGVGEAVDFQGIEVEDRRSEGFGYGVMGSGSTLAETGIKRGLDGDLSLDGYDRRGGSAAVGSGSMAWRRSRRIAFATRS